MGQNNELRPLVPRFSDVPKSLLILLNIEYFIHYTL